MNNRQIITILTIVITAIFVFWAFFGIKIGRFDFGSLQPQKLSEAAFGKVKMDDLGYRFGLDLKGGTELLYQANIPTSTPSDMRSEKMEGLKTVIERRIITRTLGTSEPEIQIQKEGDAYHLSVKIAGLTDSASAQEEIGKIPVLEFREESADYERLTKDKSQDQLMEELINGTTTFDMLYSSTRLSGQYLKSSKVQIDQNSNDPVVTLEFDAEGAKVFEELTDKNKGKILAIFIDGTPISTPKVKDKISGGNAVISGSFDIEEAKTLSRNLNEGAIPVKVMKISEKTVGATLGEKSLQDVIYAGLIGLFLVIAFMVIFYRFPGILASLSLIVYFLLNLAYFKFWPGFTLTLPGIGGFILTIGMAVDANILIFARMREELAAGKDLRSAMEEGFRRAWSAIRDGNLTTIFSGIILIASGVAFLASFGATLTIGVIFSMVSALYVTRALMEISLDLGLGKIKWMWK
jgi:protein-export membrane protein SecD